MDLHHNVQHTPGAYEFSFHLHIENRDGIVQDDNGIMVCYVEGVGGSMEKMSGKYFTREGLKVRKKECNPYYFVPTTFFPRENGNVIGLGKYLGEPLKKWLEGKNDLWEVDNHNRIIVAGTTLGSFLRNVAAALTSCHREGKALGLECNKLYVEGTNFKLSDPFKYRRVGGETRILRDLKQFKELVNLVAGASHVTDESLILFNNLFSGDQEYWGLTLDFLLLHSYILCHSPLFWTIRERFNFSNAYDVMHKAFQPSFHNNITLNSGVYSVGDWWKRIPTNPLNSLNFLYYNTIQGMEQNHFLVLFLRICYHHYLSQAQPSLNAIDADIMKSFPHAFSKTYGEIFKKIDRLMIREESPLKEFIRILYKEGLDFSKVVDRAVMEIS